MHNVYRNYYFYTLCLYPILLWEARRFGIDYFKSKCTAELNDMFTAIMFSA